MPYLPFFSNAGMEFLDNRLPDPRRPSPTPIRPCPPPHIHINYHARTHARHSKLSRFTLMIFALMLWIINLELELDVGERPLGWVLIIFLFSPFVLLHAPFFLPTYYLLRMITKYKLGVSISFFFSFLGPFFFA